MGYCKILSGGTAGRYDIELDFGETKKAAILAALGAATNKNELDILQAETEIATAEAEEKILANTLLALQDIMATGTPPERANATAEYQTQAEKLAQLKIQNEPLRYKLRQLKFVRASLQKQAQQFTLFQPIQRKQAWCADFTEDRAPGSYVGTLEVKGEPDLVLIQPGARAWIPTDGIVTGREIMSPWQAYWNAAVLPGWQKWKPTYRWGTLTAIDRGANTGAVQLESAASSAQRLGVNQSDTLTGVTFFYMTCNHAAFTVGDKVIVKFDAQNWSSPRIVGFVDTPQPCIEWPEYIFIPFEFQTIGTEPLSPTRQATDYNLVACGIKGRELTGFVTSPTREFYISSGDPLFSNDSLYPPADQSEFASFSVVTPPSPGLQWQGLSVYGNPWSGAGQNTYLPADNTSRNYLQFQWGALRSTIAVYTLQWPALSSGYFVTEWSGLPPNCVAVSGGVYEYWSDWVFGATPLSFANDVPPPTELSVDGPMDTRAFINANGGNIPAQLTAQSQPYPQFQKPYDFDGYGSTTGVVYGTGSFRYKRVDN